MRCFIAIDIDDNIKNQIKHLQEDLRKKSNWSKADAKWVEPDLIHLTLKFLGEVKDREIATVCEIVSGVASGHRRFSIDINGLGYFGTALKVLWIGISPGEALLKLQKDIDARLAEAGWEPEHRKFSGHLTLCRIKKPQFGRRLAELSKDYSDLDFGSLAVNSVRVYQSHLASEGPVYDLVSKGMLS